MINTTYKDNFKGIFTVTQLNTKIKPITIFTCIDASNNTIIRTDIHEGKNYYNKFSIFMKSSIIQWFKENGDKGATFYAPKYNINKLTAKQAKEFYNVDIIPYTQNKKPKDINKSKIVKQDEFSLSLDNISKEIMLITRRLKSKDQRQDLINEIKKLSNKLTVNIPIKDVLESNTTSLIDKNYEFNYNIENKSTINKGLTQLNTLKRVENHFQNIVKRYFSTSKIPKLDIGKWKWFIFNSTNRTIDEDTIRTALECLWDELELKLSNNMKLKIAVQLRVQFNNETTRSISHLDVVTIKDFEHLLKSYLEHWAIKGEEYQPQEANKIIFFYAILPEKYKTKLHKVVDNRKLSSFTPKKILAQIPNNMDPISWGENLGQKIGHGYDIMIKKARYIINVIPQDGHNLIQIFIKQIGGYTMINKFIDRIGRDPNNPKTFSRNFDNLTIHYEDGIKLITEELIEVPYVKKLKVFNRKRTKFSAIALDIETREVEGKLDPILISLHTRPTSKSASFPIWEYKSKEAMINAALSYLLTRRHNGLNVYVHNLSNFDSIFILNTLLNTNDVKMDLTYNKDKIVKLQIQYGPPQKLKDGSSEKTYSYSITMYDSLLILPLSLDKLSKSFGKGLRKGMFPHKLVNDPNISMDYDGDFPDMKYFHQPDKLLEKEYKKFVSDYEAYKKAFMSKPGKTWNLKCELVKYCELDVISLLQVMETFASEINRKFKIDITRYPTLPSIAFAIFRTHFIGDAELPIITGEIYNDIQQAYTGGICDIYRPLARDVKGYDINSLYPAVMHKCRMPVGSPTFFEGSLPLDEIFGFVYVDVDCPEDIQTPVLGHKIKRNGIFTTLYPVGRWSNWYFTEELKSVRKYGYKFKVHKGYKFSSSIIFSEYVELLYKIKASVSPDNPWYTIAKLLLNSLYGRFGMNPFLESHAFVDLDDLADFQDDDDVSDVSVKLELTNNKVLVSFKEEGFISGGIPNVSVAVAAAITGYARAEMHKYIMNYSGDICAIDTDGAKYTCTLDDKYVGSALGAMKYEGGFSQMIHLGPKFYGGINYLGEALVKVKGLKRKISYWMLNWLLYNRITEIKHTIWRRDFMNSTIVVVDQGYRLEINSNKRKTIFDSCGKFVSTKPYHLDGDKILNLFDEILYYLPIQPVLLSLMTPPLALPLPRGYDINYGPLSPPMLNPVIYLPGYDFTIGLLPAPFNTPTYLQLPIYIPPLCLPLQFPPLSCSDDSPLPLVNSVIVLPPPSFDIVNIKPIRRDELRVYDCESRITTIYPSMSATSKALHICDKTIRRFIKHGSLAKYRGRYIFYKPR